MSDIGLEQHSPSTALSSSRLERVAENVWIHDAPKIVAGGLPLPLRMTIIRLSSGDVLLHSPTQYDGALQQQIESLGEIRYLVAPNIAHWMFLPDWQRALPQAHVLAAPGLDRRSQVRESGLRIDQELIEPLEEWAGEIETVLINAPFFTEVALFHKPTRTLVLTDLVQNIERGDLPPVAATAADMLGNTAPDGEAPAYLRAILHLGGRSVVQAANRLIALAPERVIFAHGRWFKADGQRQLARSLRWLGAAMQRSRAQDMRGRCVVITGASSGIGRAAALAFAQRGANVVLAARRKPLLDELAAAFEGLGGRAIAVEADVTDPEAMKRLAECAEQAFGGVDVWINNAGVGVFGAFQDAELAQHRQTIEVNLLGTMNGTYAVLPIFLRQRHGVLINTISLGGWSPTPFAAAYTASKFGLRGFTASLRQELRPIRGIHVCAVFPAMVDTPGFVHGANMSGKTLDPGPLLYQAEDVAAVFVRLVKRPRAEVAVGWPARAAEMSYALAPRITEELTGAALRWLLGRANRSAKSEGAMLAPISRGTATSGGWLARRGLPPAGEITRLAIGASVAALGVGALATMWLGRQRRAR